MTQKSTSEQRCSAKSRRLKTRIWVYQHRVLTLLSDQNILKWKYRMIGPKPPLQRPPDHLFGSLQRPPSGQLTLHVVKQIRRWECAWDAVRRGDATWSLPHCRLRRRELKRRHVRHGLLGTDKKGLGRARSNQRIAIPFRIASQCVVQAWDSE